MSSNLIVETSALTYRYGKDAPVLHGIDLRIERGSIYGFLGPNGSGKTTTLSLLLGLLRAQDGEISVFGQNLKTDRLNILKRVGSLIESPSLYGHLNAQENLEVYRRVYDKPKERISEVLSIVGLHDAGTKPVKKYSLGMKQRLAIALALLPSPELLILDEPVNGLDPAGIIELRALIKNLNENFGITVIISSHLLQEIEKISTALGIIFQGRLIFQGSLPELKAIKQQAARLIVNTSDNAAAAACLPYDDPQKHAGGLSLKFHAPADIARINRTITDNGLDVFLLQPENPDLEQLFINLTKTK